MVGKINVFSSGRFHVLDLSRELDKLGYDVRFYSYVPKKRCVKFGLRPECCKSLFWICLPMLAIRRVFSFTPALSRALNYLDTLYLDFWASLLMRKCDIFIGMSGVSVRTLKTAKRKGAKVLLERGCKHILEQAKILSNIPVEKKKTVPKVDIKRELLGYSLADYVVVPSDHARVSFEERGFEKSNLFQNPYGVDVGMFTPTIKSLDKNIYDVIIVGGWSYQKGVDLLAEVCLNILGVKLLHVGAIVDCPLPQHENFTHIDPVNQPLLQNYYAQAKTFALPSRQDGFGLVMVQAIACGLPVVCSKHTGGRDLRSFLSNKKWIVEMQEYNTEALASSIRQALLLYETMPDNVLRNYAGSAINQVTWEAYGKRYDAFIRSL